jgi:TonB family protein
MSTKAVALALVCWTLGLVPHVSAAQETPKASAGPGIDQPLRVGGAVLPPKRILGDRPVYTEIARKARVQGVVILQTIIDEQGNVTDIKVLKGLPMGLDQAAMDAAWTWKFEPATFEGQPVKVYYVLTVNFQLDGSPYQGPAILQFRRDHPDFAKAMDEARYEEAQQLLGRSNDPERGLARVYLLLEQDLFDDAWHEAQRYDGANRYEALRAVAAFTLRGAQPSIKDTPTRLRIAEIGLAAADRAIEARPDVPDALVDKRDLLREKAKLVEDPDEKRRLTEEADRIHRQSLEMRKAGASPGSSEAPDPQP